ncbi:MAG TPA: hypothetical protein VD978_37300 [Azospirillum sp.]|nr:hypothetical protein [Azospirillum sp.]
MDNPGGGEVGKWIGGGAVGIVAFIGLLAASRAADEAFYYGGLIVAAAAVAYIFWMISNHYDRVDADLARRRHRDTAHR